MVYGIVEYIQSISEQVVISSIIIKVELKLDFTYFWEIWKWKITHNVYNTRKYIKYRKKNIYYKIS